VPKEIRDRHGFGNGSAFAALETKDGALSFRPVSAKPKLDLIENLKRLKGLEIPAISGISRSAGLKALSS
jgi:bifunctional DNA-binding transcriptional regulator/antitoxin component of YhaV-PrlF toxin-antitoxin module